MVVDDDASILIAVREIFENIGYEVYTVSSGEDCIDELKKGYRGVILMDIMMPRMDGWDTIQEMVDNNLHENNTIIMLTARHMPDERYEDLKKYVKGYITKPFDPRDLIKNVDEHCQ